QAITVTPSVEQILEFHNQVTMVDDLNATLTVGELSGNIVGLGGFQLGPLYQQTFNLARAPLMTLYDNQANPTILADSTTALPSFTIGDTLHPSLAVTTTADTGAIGSLRYAVNSADLLSSQNPTTPLIIALGPGTYKLNSATMGSLGVTASN